MLVEGLGMREMEALLERARAIAVELLAPAAEATDQAELLPAGHLDRLAVAGLLGLAIPVEYGGRGAPRPVVREYQEILAAACGVTTFVQMQHVSAGGLIAGGENEALKRELLPLMAAGARRCSLAFSHLRRPGPPMVRAARDGDAWTFDGVAPWLTGWGRMDEVVLAGTLADGRFLYVVAPLAESEGLRASPPMRLCAMSASGTVSLTLQGFRVPADRYLKTVTPEQMRANDLAAALGPTAFSLGVARAAAASVAALGDQRGSAALQEAAAALVAEVTAAREDVDRWAERVDSPSYAAEAFRVRAWCIELGVRAAHAAAVAAGGSANRLDHPAQRRYREALAYTLLAQTRDVQAATLARATLTSREAGRAGSS
jgi:alkylation response protein AidB-like acyl-CoA dehydrogenase